MTANRILLMIGGEHHPFEAFGAYAKQLLEEKNACSVTVTDDRNAFLAERIGEYDVVAAYTQGGELTPDQEAGLLGFVLGGGAFFGIHGATASWKKNDGYIDMIGGVFISHGPVEVFPVNMTAVISPVTAGMADFSIEDELYIHDRFYPEKVKILAETPVENDMAPLIWTKKYGEGRVCYLALGHDERAYTRPEFNELLFRGFAWLLD